MRDAVLVMAYGSPASPADIEAYYTHVRRGRPPTPELLADLTRRYEAIGGVSPLAERTEAQAAAIRRALDARAPGRFTVALGMKHAAPFVEDAVDDLLDHGARRIAALVLAPHYSAASVGEYLTRVRTQVAARDPEVVVAAVDSWHRERPYIELLTNEVGRTLAHLPPRTKVLFTAHSIPRRVVEAGDPYPAQVRETAAAVAAEAGLDRWAGWSVAWQSAGRTAEPWLGPHLVDVVRDLAATGRADGVLVCPCGFTSDHLEILYDLDVEAAAVAESVGLRFARTAVVNDDPDVMGALAARVVAAADTVATPGDTATP